MLIDNLNILEAEQKMWVDNLNILNRKWWKIALKLDQLDKKLMRKIVFAEKKIFITK